MANQTFKPKQQQITAWIEANFDFKPRRGGAEYVICNPLTDDSTYNFNINVEEGICHDWHGDEWAQGQSRTFLRFVQLYRRCSFVDAFKEVCGKDVTIDAIYAKLTKEKIEKAEERKYDLALPPGCHLLCDYGDTISGRILTTWLKSRGLTDATIKSYQLYSHSMHVVWPYYEYGSLVYWQERSRMNKVFRFPSEAVGVSKGMFLYGFDMVEPGDYVIVTEAIFDSTTLGAQAVASGGAVLTDLQVRRLRALNPVNGVILAPDNDSAGMKSVASNYRMLRPYFKKIFYAVPPKIEYKKGHFVKDWNELITDAKMTHVDIRKLFESSIKLLNQTEAVRFMVNS